MLTGYWPIDAFFYANIALYLCVAGVFVLNQYRGGGALISANADPKSKE